MIQAFRVPERIYHPITAMGFSAMFTFQLDNTTLESGINVALRLVIVRLFSRGYVPY